MYRCLGLGYTATSILLLLIASPLLPSLPASLYGTSLFSILGLFKSSWGLCTGSECPSKHGRFDLFEGNGTHFTKRLL